MNSKRLCRQCRDYFRPENVKDNLGFCSESCKLNFAIDFRDKEHKKRLEKVRLANERRKMKDAEHKVMKKVYTKNKNEAEKVRRPAADKAFHSYVRKRDELDACISCSRVDADIEWTIGGKWDCGHFTTKAVSSFLRYHPDNAHKQCKSCNGGSGKYTKKNATVSDEYKLRLVKKIGLKRVKSLEANKNNPCKRTASDYREIEAHYKLKLKELVSCE